MEKDEKPSIGQRLGDYPRYGSPLLSTLWLIIRTLSGLALLVIVGTIAYTIERFDRTGDLPPVLVIEGISMAAFGAIYTLIVMSFWYHRANRSLWIMSIFDLAFSGMFIYIGRSVSEPSVDPQCSIAGLRHPLAAARTKLAGTFAADISSRGNGPDTLSGFAEYVLSNHIPCSVIMAIWIPCIVLAVAFFIVAILNLVLWLTGRRERSRKG